MIIMTKDKEKATFAAGCFWGVQALFDKLTGVISTRVGYTGGHVENPSYQQVCKGDTGHAEAVEIIYNPAEINYQDLLEIFWENHNPTTPNQQGANIGEQYRSAVFYHNPSQKEAADKMKDKLNNSQQYDQPIVTEITKAETFYQAEEYHQHYLKK